EGINGYTNGSRPGAGSGRGRRTPSSKPLSRTRSATSSTRSIPYRLFKNSFRGDCRLWATSDGLEFDFSKAASSIAKSAFASWSEQSSSLGWTGVKICAPGDSRTRAVEGRVIQRRLELSAMHPWRLEENNYQRHSHRHGTSQIVSPEFSVVEEAGSSVGSAIMMQSKKKKKLGESGVEETLKSSKEQQAVAQLPTTEAEEERTFLREAVQRASDSSSSTVEEERGKQRSNSFTYTSSTATTASL
ncbi:unnamed protein product, partial [Amoebophrya sp. A25]